MDEVVPRDKAEGWYVLHDFRDVEWQDWNSVEEEVRETTLEEGVDYLEDLMDVDEGSSAVYSVLGHKADLLFIHVRPEIEELDAVERGFEQTWLADFTWQTGSYLSVTEVGGYTNEDVEEGEVSDYARSKLYPDIPDKRYVSFYPMSRRRGEEFNWYTLPLEDREEMMNEHRRSGQKFAGKVKQLISGSIGMDDWEWGVDLFVDDLKQAKKIVYEMRFDEASARYSEFGGFYVGVRFMPDHLKEFLNGEVLTDVEDRGGIRGELRDQGVYAGKPHGEDVYALVLYSEEDPEVLAGEVDGLRGNFEHYDTHVKTAVYGDGGGAAVVSVWETESAAETAAGYLSDLPGVTGRAGEEDGWGTMGMFYTVKPDYREEFVEKFSEVEGLLEGMEGHIETSLYVNTGDENDMFIASEWVDRESAMEFFRSDEFRDTVDWGREVLDDRPRHVFLA